MLLIHFIDLLMIVWCFPLLFILVDCVGLFVVVISLQPLFDCTVTLRCCCSRLPLLLLLCVTLLECWYVVVVPLLTYLHCSVGCSVVVVFTLLFTYRC